MGPPNHQLRRQKTSKQHKAAVELASQRRQLAKVLKREGVSNVSAVFESTTKRPKLEENKAEEAEQAPPVRSLADREAKLKERKRRSQLLTKKTRKGQPIMRNVIKDLVSRLQE